MVSSSSKAPNYTKTIICLANSRKISGRCVAGKIVGGKQRGEWIRPISKRPKAELSLADRRYKDGSDPKLLQIVRIPMIEVRPQGFQTENHLIDDTFYWATERTATWDEAAGLVDVVQGALWDNSSSTRRGRRDRVHGSKAAEFTDSLKLVEVEDLTIRISVEGAEFNNPKKKIRGRFSLNETEYVLAITDPVVEEKYRRTQQGTFEMGKALLCISLGELHDDGYAYKLIAGVMLPP